jgi:Ca2+-binding RTX toxin-like protein
LLFGLKEASMVNRIGTARGDLLTGSNRDDYFEDNGVSQRPAGVTEQDTIEGLLGFDTMLVTASSSATFIGSAGTGDWTVGSSDGNTNVVASGIERVLFFGSGENDVFNTGNASGSVTGRGGMDLWVANFGTRSVDMRFHINDGFGILAVDVTVNDIDRVFLTTGSGDDDIITGKEGDSITSGAGDDRVDLGTRRVFGETGADFWDGGDDTDTLIVHAEGETQGVGLGTVTDGFFVRSTTNRIFVDAVDVERVEFFGGLGDDVINTGAGAVIVKGDVGAERGMDHWICDLSAAARGFEYRVGQEFGLQSLGIKSVTGIDRITMTAGRFDDTIIGGAEGDFVDGGAGNDIVDMKTRRVFGETGADLFEAGTGMDTLVADCSNETDGVSLGLLAGGFFVRSVSNRFFVDAEDCEKVRFTGGSGNDVINSGRGGERIAGGGGIDLWIADYGFTNKDIRLDLPPPGGGFTTSLPQLGLLSLTGIDQLNLTTGSGNDSVTGGAQGDTFNGGAGRDIADLKTRQVFGETGADLFNAGAGIDTLIANLKQETQGVSLGVTGNGFFVRSTSNRFYVDAVDCELVRFTGGSGNDVIETGGRGGTIDGWLGVDRWIVNFAATGKAIDFALGEVDTLSFLGVTSIQRVEAMTFTGGSGNDRLTGGAFSDVINGGGGNDTIDGGARGAKGTDQTDFVDGGGGNDTLLIDASQERDAVSLFGGPNFSLRSTSNRFILDSVNFETVDFQGGFGNDLAAGGAGKDVLNGREGNDTLNGGLGADTLDGRVGKDTFRFDTALGPKNVDVVLNFTARDDVIELDDAVFTELAFGKLKAGEFRFGQAQDGNDHILVLNQRQLWYDPDGDGREQAVLFAILNSGSIGLTEKDFVVI